MKKVEQSNKLKIWSHNLEKVDLEKNIPFGEDIDNEIVLETER